MIRLARDLGKAFGWKAAPEAAPVPEVAPATAAIVADLLGRHAATVIDVGARWGMDDAWYRMPPLAKLVGFEPDPEECARLNRAVRERGDTHHYYVPRALGRQVGTATLHLTAEPACSSLYPPDPAMRERHPALEVTRPVGQRSVALTTLRDWAAAEKVQQVAFIKLDTQGSELDILHGADPLLETCLGIEVEVEFNAIYQGQPLFADVDTYLRQRGFCLWRLSNLAHYSERPETPLTREEHVFYDHASGSHRAGSGRLTWANALYFRDYRGPGMERRSLLILAALLHAAGDSDAARCCLERSLLLPGAEAGQGRAVEEQASRLRAA